MKTIITILLSLLGGCAKACGTQDNVPTPDPQPAGYTITTEPDVNATIPGPCEGICGPAAVDPNG